MYCSDHLDHLALDLADSAYRYSREQTPKIIDSMLDDSFDSSHTVRRFKISQDQGFTSFNVRMTSSPISTKILVAGVFKTHRSAFLELVAKGHFSGIDPMQMLSACRDDIVTLQIYFHPQFIQQLDESRYYEDIVEVTRHELQHVHQIQIEHRLAEFMGQRRSPLDTEIHYLQQLAEIEAFSAGFELLHRLGARTFQEQIQHTGKNVRKVLLNHGLEQSQADIAVLQWKRRLLKCFQQNPQMAQA